MYFGPRTPPTVARLREMICEPDATAEMLRRLSSGQALLLLALLLAAALVASAGVGAFSFSPARMARFLGEGAGVDPAETGADALERGVFLRLRLPRVLLAGLTGAVLGVSGTLMQGLFRNPIVEPGLVGTSAGAALGAALVFVFGGRRGLRVHRPARLARRAGAGLRGGVRGDDAGLPRSPAPSGR